MTPLYMCVILSVKTFVCVCVCMHMHLYVYALQIRDRVIKLNLMYLSKASTVHV